MSSRLMVYAYEFYNLLTRGDLVNTRSISEVGITPFYGRIVTKRSVQKVWAVTSLPVVFETTKGVPINLTDLILGESKKSFPHVVVNFLFNCDPVAMNTTNKRFTSEFNKADTRYHQFKDIFEEHLSESEQLTGKVVKGPKGRRIRIEPRQLVNVRDRYESYRYVAEHVNKNGEFALTNLFIHAHARDKHELKRYDTFLRRLLSKLEVYNTDLNGDLDTYLESYCPAGYVKPEAKRFKQMLLSNENLASLMPYTTKGLIGNKGIPVGLDIDSTLPMFVDFFNSGNGQIVGAYGRTGSGKTFLLQHLALSMLAEGVHVSALDIKGSEWTKLFSLVKGKLISMEGKGSRFVNTLRIDDMPVVGLDEAEVQGIYDMALEGTVQLLQVMCNLDRSHDTDIDVYRLLSSAVTKVYNKAGVYRNNGLTFVRTRDLTYNNVLTTLQEMSGTPSFGKHEALLIKIVDRLSAFLSKDGNMSHVFENELTLNEVIDTPLIVYSLNKNAELATTILDTLRIFMIQYLDTKKQSLRKIQKKHSVVFYEELQRCNQFGRLLSYISSVVTGSRSNNVKVFLLFNSLRALDDPDAQAIKSNISSWFIGNVNRADKIRFIEEFGMENYVEFLDRVEEGLANHSFFANIDTGDVHEQAIIRVNTPDDFKEALRTVDGAE